jgi:putative ABC transport system substrate-binding protein
LVAKRVELMHEVLRGTRSIALLVNPTSPNLTRIAIEDAQAAARRLALELHILNASTEPELDAAFANVNRRRSGGLVIGTDAFFTSRLERLAALAIRHRVPAVYHFREFTAAGGLLSYGGSITDAFRETGAYVGRILKGDKPANLPVQQVTKVDLCINLKTAKALGINIPNTLLARANEVIE